jgi:hypothetical protein
MSIGEAVTVVLVAAGVLLALVSWRKHTPIVGEAVARARTWTAMPLWWTRGYQRAIAISEEHKPYALGGGHDPSRPFLPSKDWRAGLSNVVGYDCSGVVSAVLHAMGLLGVALGTHELEHWGSPGRGQRMTVWVANRWINGRPVEHCVIEFREGVPASHRFFMAYFTGGPPAGFSAYFDTTGYSPRRRKA